MKNMFLALLSAILYILSVYIVREIITFVIGVDFIYNAIYRFNIVGVVADFIIALTIYSTAYVIASIFALNTIRAKNGFITFNVLVLLWLVFMIYQSYAFGILRLNLIPILCVMAMCLGQIRGVKNYYVGDVSGERINKKVVALACLIAVTSIGVSAYGQIQQANYTANYTEYANSKELLKRADEFAQLLGYYNFSYFLKHDEVMKEFDLSEYTVLEKMEAVANLYGYESYQELEDDAYQQNGEYNYYKMEEDYGYPRREQ